jgi:argininosuccinate lyase
VEKWVPFREAHHAVREVVQKALEDGKKLDELPIGDYVEVHKMFDPSIFDLLDPAESTARRDLPGGTGPTSVTQQIDGLRSWLQDQRG